MSPKKFYKQDSAADFKTFLFLILFQFLLQPQQKPGRSTSDITLSVTKRWGEGRKRKKATERTSPPYDSSLAFTDTIATYFPLTINLLAFSTSSRCTVVVGATTVAEPFASSCCDLPAASEEERT